MELVFRDPRTAAIDRPRSSASSYCLVAPGADRIRQVIMRQIEFMTSEDDQELIVSFALAASAHRSLNLLRSPQWEHLRPEQERGATVAPLDPSDVDTDHLVCAQWLGARVVVTTQRHDYELDVSAVDERELVDAKAVLRKTAQPASAAPDVATGRAAKALASAWRLGYSLRAQIRHPVPPVLRSLPC